MPAKPPGSRIPREVLLHEVSRALREQLPDRAEPIIRELEKRLLRDPPATPRTYSMSVAVQADRHRPGLVAETVMAMVDRIERRQAEGPRFRWGVTVQGGAGEGTVYVEVRATPAKKAR
jgi:hypothetical protein